LASNSIEGKHRLEQGLLGCLDLFFCTGVEVWMSSGFVEDIGDYFATQLAVFSGLFEQILIGIDERGVQR